MNNTTLSALSEGCCATVTGIDSKGSIRRRLMDLGLIEGTLITCLHRSPFGDPAAYLIRGAVIALRKADADNIRVM